MSGKPELLAFTPTVPRLFPAARAALARPPISHRSLPFGTLLDTVRSRLRALAMDRYHPVIAAGTGSWANDLMVWNILPRCRRALVLVNGEFGERLYRQCQACRSDTLRLELPWGTPYDRGRLAEGMAGTNADWIFAAATETSCGMDNDLTLLDELAGIHGMRLALDGISAAGVRPELFACRHAACISASSGKALAALPGIALLFLADGWRPEAAAGIPDSLDLTQIVAAEGSPGGVRNTLGSPQLACLDASLEALATADDYPGRLNACKRRVVEAFAAMDVVMRAGSTSAMVATFHRPEANRWRRLLAVLEQAGIALYVEPEYLNRRGLFQAVTMGDVTDAEIDRLTRALAAV